MAEGDAARFVAHVRALATRELYPDAARLLDEIAQPDAKKKSLRSVVSILCDRQTDSQIRLFRMAGLVGLIDPREATQDGALRFTLEDVHAMTKNRRTAPLAKVVLASFGFAERLPRDPRAKAALGLFHLCRAMYGARP